jgi:hypothetical protein
MKVKGFLTAIVLGIAGLASAQTYTSPIEGDVLRYEPGKVIVLRGANNAEVVYQLAPTVSMPADVQVGRHVTLYTEAGANGSSLVSRVTTTTVTPEGNVKRTTETTRQDPNGMTTKTTTTNVSGRVEAYEPGKILTITRTDGSRVSYQINSDSQLPTDLVVGKTVTILPGTSDHVAKTVTYTIVN